jgi:hypothetical protein
LNIRAIRPNPISTNRIEVTRAECADRCEIHDDADNAEHRATEIVEQFSDTPPALSHPAQREAEQHRHDQDRHDLAPGDVADEVCRDHAEEEIAQAHGPGRRDVAGHGFLLGRGGIEGG